MKSLVIYHFPCNDGFGAAFAAWLKFGDDAQYLPWNYADPKRESEEQEICRLLNALPEVGFVGREVYILDFSFRRGIMEKIFEVSKRVVWLDHHKTAFEMWMPSSPNYYTNTHTPGEEDIIVLSNYKSGALLSWEYFHPNEPAPILFRHLDDYDRWQFKIPGTREFDRNLRSQPCTFNHWELLNGQFEARDSALSSPHYDKFIADGVAILRAHEQTVRATVNGEARACDLGFLIDKVLPIGTEINELIPTRRLRGLAANCSPHLASDVGHELANESGTFGLTWYVRSDGTVSCSIRSNGDYDVEAIAKAFGGGGHKNAAGFSVDLGTLQGWFSAP